jgi:hypothetical protein
MGQAVGGEGGGGDAGVEEGMVWSQGRFSVGGRLALVVDAGERIFQYQGNSEHPGTATHSLTQADSCTSPGPRPLWRGEASRELQRSQDTCLSCTSSAGLLHGFVLHLQVAAAVMAGAAGGAVDSCPPWPPG